MQLCNVLAKKSVLYIDMRKQSDKCKTEQENWFGLLKNSRSWKIQKCATVLDLERKQQNKLLSCKNIIYSLRENLQIRHFVEIWNKVYIIDDFIIFVLNILILMWLYKKCCFSEEMYIKVFSYEGLGITNFL